MKETETTRGDRVRKIAIIPLFLFGLLSIIATGGGGGGDGGPAGFSATSEGVASKGIIRHGVVTAEELDNSGTVLRSVGSAETNAEGKYTLTVGGDYAGGPIRLTISGKSDGSTKMVCDVDGGCTEGGNTVAFGGTLSLGTDFAMYAIVPPVANGDSISAQITPFTHMAMQRVLKQVETGGTVDADSVNNAISEVNQMVGVNILDVEPVDITNATALAGASPEAVNYAAFVAGAGKLAMTGGDLKNGLQQLAQSFEDGELTNSDPINPSELVDAVDHEAMARGVASNPVLAQVMQTFRSGISGSCDTGCTYNPQPSDTATQSAVAQARALVGETRTWVTSLQDLQTPWEAFGSDLNAGGAVLDANSETLMNTLVYVFDSMDAAWQSTPPSLGTQQVAVYDAAANQLGTVSVTLADNNGLDITIAGSNLGGVSVSLTATSNLPATEVVAGNTFSLSNADLSFSGSVSNAQASMSLDQMAFKADFESSVTVDPTTNSSNTDPVFTSMSLAGDLTLQAGGASFAGSATLTFVVLNSPPSDIGSDIPTLAKLSLSKIVLNGDFAAGGNSLSAELTLTVNNAAAFDTLGMVGYQTPESVNNFANATLSISLDLTLQGYPGTQATVSGNRTAFEGGDITVTFTHGGHSVTFVASKADGNTPGDGTLTVTNPDGVKLVLTATEGAVSGTLKVNGAQVGSVQQTTNDLIIARYNDGTFETLQ
jgi:hypothetical protein